MADAAAEREWLHAGRVGRPHGLDGSFLVIEPNAVLLRAGGTVLVAGAERAIERLAGHERRLIVRLEGCADRAAAEALRGQALLVARAEAPELEQDEWWAEDLEGLSVRDGTRDVGTVRRLLALPSCEVLEVERSAGGRPLLVPLVSDAVRAVDLERRLIDVDLEFLGEE
ncbi:MAG: 16S rRNA processing protein RimM [Acidobacteriota bacterium]|nr:16S rRNA processing protein RimM [Acidobacteriota bacterium]